MNIQTEKKSVRFLSASSLKIMACVFMLIDHIGLELYPEISTLRIIGRLAYPIFAFFIAEGCKYTKNKTKRFILIFVLGLFCELIYVIYNGYYYGNILITFSLSILLIYSLQRIAENSRIADFVLFAIMLAASYFISTKFGVDYGFAGVLAPVFAIIPDLKEKKSSIILKLGIFTIGLLFVVWQNDMNGMQKWSLFAVPVLALYNGKAGNRKFKYGFYIFYPLHLLVIYFISALMNYWRS